MPRQARVVAEGVPHHITQRGNNRQDVFLLDEDRRFYLDNLRFQARRHGVRLLGYCLMGNHVHLIAVPERPDGLALALGRLHGNYARRFNRRYRRSGHLWQNRFYSCPLGPSHLWRALLYVDMNPVRAGMLSDPTAYPWSSAAAHANRDAAGLLDSREWHEVDPDSDWKQLLLTRAPDAAECASLRAATYQGHPFGDARFVKTLEARLARNLQPKPMGRPPKARTVGAA
jgi:putative transposase